MAQTALSAALSNGYAGDCALMQPADYKRLEILDNAQRSAT
jgi:hypothetical protein